MFAVSYTHLDVYKRQELCCQVVEVCGYCTLPFGQFLLVLLLFVQLLLIGHGQYTKYSSLGGFFGYIKRTTRAVESQVGHF